MPTHMLRAARAAQAPAVFENGHTIVRAHTPIHRGLHANADRGFARAAARGMVHDHNARSAADGVSEKIRFYFYKAGSRGA